MNHKRETVQEDMVDEEAGAEHVNDSAGSHHFSTAKPEAEFNDGENEKTKQALDGLMAIKVAAPLVFTYCAIYVVSHSGFVLDVRKRKDELVPSARVTCWKADAGAAPYLRVSRRTAELIWG